MARYQLILAYDGTDFQGYQRQANARTVQGEFEKALTRLGWVGKATQFAGRTDCGVHAAGQSVAFDLQWNHSTDELVRAVNANLPVDVAAQLAREVAPDFHPRFDARGRTYRYQIACAPQRNPLRDRFAWQVWPELDLQLLRQAGQRLLGVHDFSAFGSALRRGGRTEREVFSATWQLQPGGLLFEVSANAFLYHMVRRMVYLQVQVGRQRLELDCLTLAVEAAQPQPPGLAPAHGLSLYEVCY